MEEELEKQKTKWFKNKKLLIILSSILLLAIILTSILIISLNKKDVSIEKKEEIDTPKEYLSEEEITNMYTDTTQYIDRDVKISGQIIAINELENYYEVKITRKIEPKWEQTTIIQIEDIKEFEIFDLISVEGVVKTNNTTDTGVIIPVIKASNIEKAYYVDIVRPTIKYVPVNETKYKHDCSFTITKVEIAERETRVYITVKNANYNTLLMYPLLSIINQNGKEYKATMNYKANYAELPSSVDSAKTVSGIIVFPAIEQSNFTLDFVAYANILDSDAFENITFNINVQ